MAEAFTEKIDAALAESSVLDELPAEIEGFVLSKERQMSEGQYDFFCYDHAAKHRAVVGFYDASTARRDRCCELCPAVLYLWRFCDIRMRADTQSAARDGGASRGYTHDTGTAARARKPRKMGVREGAAGGN